MLTVRYDPITGLVVADGAVVDIAECWLNLYLAGSLTEITVGCETLFNQFRLLILREKISHTDIQFAFADQIIKVNQYGRLETWPTGMADLTVTQVTEIIRTTVSKKKGG